MLRDARYLAMADLRSALKRRETRMWAFLLPVVFSYFIGTVTSGYGGPAPGERMAVLGAAEGGFLADALLGRLTKAGYTVVPVAGQADLARYDRGLIIPAGFTQMVLAKKAVKLEFVRKEGGMGGDYDRVRLAKATYTVLADLLMVVKDGGEVNAASLAKWESAPRLLTLESKQAGQRKRAPSGFEQAVPGNLVFFLLIVLLTSGPALLVVEREQGILRRLASTPISRGEVVLGKWGGRMGLAIIQIMFCMLTGSVLFGVRWGAQVPMVFLVLAAYAGLAAAAGLVIGSFARTRGEAAAVGSITSNVLAAVGGCWWPAEIMPRPMQVAAHFTPPGIAMDALHQLVNFGAGAEAVLPHLAVLVAGALVMGAIAARVFRFQ